MKSRELLLQPVSAGDLIDRALRLYRAHLGPLLAITAAPGLIAVLGGSLTVFAGADLLLTATGNLLTYGLSPILSFMVIGALTQVVANHVMEDSPISFRGTWQVIFKHGGRLLGVALIGWLFLPLSLGILTAILMVGIGILAGMTAFFFSPALAGQSGSWLVILPIVMVTTAALLGGGLFFLEIYGRVVMMPAVAIYERQPVGSAVARGLRLGAKTGSVVLAVLAFEYCITWSIAIALGVFLGADAAVAGFSFDGTTETMALIFNILLQFGNLLAAPVAAVSFALLYFDNRVRKEGMDIEILAQEIPFPSPPAATAEPILAGGWR